MRLTHRRSRIRNRRPRAPAPDRPRGPRDVDPAIVGFGGVEVRTLDIEPCRSSGPSCSAAAATRRAGRRAHRGRPLRPEWLRRRGDLRDRYKSDPDVPSVGGERVSAVSPWRQQHGRAVPLQHGTTSSATSRHEPTAIHQATTGSRRTAGEPPVTNGPAIPPWRRCRRLSQERDRLCSSCGAASMSPMDRTCPPPRSSRCRRRSRWCSAPIARAWSRSLAERRRGFPSATICRPVADRPAGSADLRRVRLLVPRMRR